MVTAGVYMNLLQLNINMHFNCTPSLTTNDATDCKESCQFSEFTLLQFTVYVINT